MSRSAISSYCSWCLQKSKGSLSEQCYVSRNVYSCSNCDHGITRCRAIGCSNWACWDKHEEAGGTGKKATVKRKYQYCGEHNGSVANFDTLNSRLDDPGDYLKIVKPRCWNKAKLNTFFLVGSAGIVVLGPLSYVAAPAVGGAIGATFGLSGAAAVNAGLAFLGGGSLAAGGLGIAGGTAAVTVFGSAVGGTLGGVLANRYFGDVQDFRIEKVREGPSPAVITINGFLSQKNQDLSDWAGAIAQRYPKNAWYHVHWESKNLAKLGGYLTTGATRKGLQKLFQKIAEKALKEASKKVAGAAAAVDIIGVASNPWHVALVKAEKTGVMLADALSRCDGPMKYVFLGHSLGARVAFSALQTLSTTDRVSIKDVHLLGGAVDSGASNWRHAKMAVAGTIFNYHSQNDAVLKYLYSVGTFFSSSPIGRHEIEGAKGIVNVDVSSSVSGHMAHKGGAAKDNFLR